MASNQSQGELDPGPDRPRTRAEITARREKRIAREREEHPVPEDHGEA